MKCRVVSSPPPQELQLPVQFHADWIGLFGIGVPSTGYQEGYWQYVPNGLSGTLMFKAPSQPGEYELRYLLDDGFIDVARAPVTVG